jgi:hypothetical protein
MMKKERRNNMNKKKIFSILLSACILFGAAAPTVYAVDDSGKIDLYEVFSNKDDQMKTEVGSRIYKWSMHLPDDAVIYKSDRANYFDMSTNSYNASVELEINKNRDELTLEDMLYKMQNTSSGRHFRRWGDKEFVVDIAKDSYGQRYIRVIKTDKVYDHFLMNEAAEELGDYIENRIYIANNYIYDLTIDMNGEFYRKHEEMFDKLVSSFKLSFDEKNPHIKELSDSVSTTRECKNTSYGWEITMSPYWKLENSPNARYQQFSPVYSDEELSGNEKIEEETEDEFKMPEGITVSLISSTEKGETASKWAKRETDILKNNYHNDVYKILENKSQKQGDMDIHHVVISYKTVTKKPYIVHNMYIVGNGYRYLVSGTMMEEKYKDADKRSSFEDMINSFKLNKEHLSEYLGKITPVESIMNLNAKKELEMKKYNFKTKVTKRWNTSGNGYYDYYDDFYYDDFYYDDYRGNISNDEYVSAYEPEGSIRLSMSAGLNTEEMKEIITQNVERYLRNDEIRMNLAKVKIQSTKYNDAEIYYIEKEYDLEAIKKFVDEDETKKYDLERLENEYTRIIKIGKDIYSQDISLPVANMTSENKDKVDNIWENTTINKVNYSKKKLKWKQHKLEEFDKENNKDNK